MFVNKVLVNLLNICIGRLTFLCYKMKVQGNSFAGTRPLIIFPEGTAVNSTKGLLTLIFSPPISAQISHRRIRGRRTSETTPTLVNLPIGTIDLTEALREPFSEHRTIVTLSRSRGSTIPVAYYCIRCSSGCLNTQPLLMSRNCG